MADRFGYNFPTPPPGQVAPVPNEVIFQMMQNDDACNQLEDMAEKGRALTGGRLDQIGGAGDYAGESESNEIVDY